MVETVTVTNELIQKMVQAVVKAVEPEQVVLFGSQASGEADPNSDVDLLVIQSEPFGPNHNRIAEMTRIWRSLAKVGVPTDIVLYGWDEVDAWKDSCKHVTTRALQEGQVLYERSGSGQAAIASGGDGLAGTGGDAGCNTTMKEDENDN